MRRTQIQLPEPLWKEVNQVAELEDWSMAEVIRRGTECFVRRYRGKSDRDPWTPPEAKDLGDFKIPTDRWREAALGDEERA